MKSARRLAFRTLFVAFVLSGVAGPGVPAAAAPEDDMFRTFLSRDRIGAARFVRDHPTWDGRGPIVLAVLDTGVDMTLPGLETTPEGGVKVIAARDFSGQGDVSLARAREESVDGEKILRTDDGWVPLPSGLPGTPMDGRYWLGFLDESRFRNSEVSDINANGRKDDRFAMLVVRMGSCDAPRWTLYPDRDADGELDDEAPIHDFVDEQKTFTFSGADPTEHTAPLAFAPTVIDEGLRPELSLHFADGSHGSHVAGIAAGYRILGEDGFDGIAPGARILSLKIGNNTLAGGSTTPGSMKKALEYAGEWSATHGEFVVMNISYGIGSETEGRHAIDELVDEIVQKYPRVAIATSAGNSGPGLSTVGTPAGATLVLAAAALLTPDNARELYGAKLSRERLFAFSSRGGELDKPDVVAPGVAWSTVPDWERFAIFRGTSMASPQVAGAILLLASAAAAQAPPLAITGGMMYRAVRHTARPLEDTLPLAQGGGVVDVPAAFDALRRFADRGEADAPLGFAVETDVPTQPDGVAPAAFWRAGGFFPVSPLSQEFRVHALLPKTLSAEARQDSYETYDLRADARWLSVDRRTAGLRAEMPTTIRVSYDPGRLREPGVYTGRVVATPRRASRSRIDTAFTLTSTVIVPHRFDRGNGYGLRLEGQKLSFGHLRRWFVLAPPGATTLDVRVAPHRRDFAYVQLYLFDPAGRMLPADGRYAVSEDGSEARATVLAEELQASGVYELVVYADYRRYGDRGRSSVFDLDLRFSGVSVGPLSFHQEDGGAPEGTVEVANRFDEIFVGNGEAVVSGVARTDTYDIEDNVLAHEFELGGPVRGVTFELELSALDYARYTDVALSILDQNDKAVAAGGFMGRRAVVSLPSGEGRYRLELRAAATAESDEAVSVRITERCEYAEPVPVSVKKDGDAHFALYPGVPVELSLALARVPPRAPDGFRHVGALRLVDARTKRRWLERRFSFGSLPAEAGEEKGSP